MLRLAEEMEGPKTERVEDEDQRGSVERYSEAEFGDINSG